MHQSVRNRFRGQSSLALTILCLRDVELGRTAGCRIARLHGEGARPQYPHSHGAGDREPLRTTVSSDERSGHSDRCIQVGEAVETPAKWRTHASLS